MNRRISESSEILTVMFTDIVGYTKTTAQLSREEFHELHDLFDSISLPIFERFAGKVIKKIGDAFLITFKSPTNAVLCGMELQNSFDWHNRQSKRPIKIRVAIHTGEVITRHDDVFGEAVNTASRIEGVADAGQVVFSEAVFSAMNKKEVSYVHLGLRHLKGLKYPIRLFRVKTRRDEIAENIKLIKDIIKIFVLMGIIGLLIFFILQLLFSQFL